MRFFHLYKSFFFSFYLAVIKGAGTLQTRSFVW